MSQQQAYSDFDFVALPRLGLRLRVFRISGDMCAALLALWEIRATLQRDLALDH